MVQSPEESRDPDGVEQPSEAEAGEPSESGAAATRAILESPESHMLDEQQLDERDRGFGEKRKPMGPPLEDEDRDSEAREEEGGEDIDDLQPIDPDEPEEA
jgi:hypothetical protein